MWQPYGFWLHQKLNKNKSQGIERTKEWFEKLRPEPTLDNFIIHTIFRSPGRGGWSLEALGLPYMELLETSIKILEKVTTQFLQDTFYNVEPKAQKDWILRCYVWCCCFVGSAYMLNQDIVKALDDVNRNQLV